MTAITAPGFYPFTIAALILVGLVAVELIVMVVGLSLSALDSDGFTADGDHGLLGAWMSWLNAGGVPLLVLVMIWLASFAIAGFALQGVMQGIIAPLPTLAAILAALAAAVPMTRLLSRWTARIFPRDETTAVSQVDFIGLVGLVTLGPLDQGKPGRVRVRDRHGNIHVLRTKAAGVHSIPHGAAVLIVDGSDGLFEAIPAPAELGADPSSQPGATRT